MDLDPDVGAEYTPLKTVDAGESTEARRPRQGRVGKGVIAAATVAALGVGIVAGALFAGGNDSAETTGEQRENVATVAVDDGHIVPSWLPDGLKLQSADTAGRAAAPCHPDAIGSRQSAGLPVPQLITELKEVGPGVCAVPSTYLQYLSAPATLGSAPSPPAQLTFVEAGPGDIRSPAPTTAITVRGRNGLLYQGPPVWLAWADDNHTFFITANGLSADDVMRVAESVAAIDAAQWAALRSSAVPPLVSGGPPWRTEVMTCLRAQGLDVPDPATRPGSVTQQYPPEAAQKAWQACRDSYVRLSGMPVSAVTPALAVPDCMAAQGWLIVVMASPMDTAAFNTAMQKCQPGSAISPPWRTELTACLRARGVDLPEPATGPSSVLTTKRYPPEVAQAAWQACRDSYVRGSGIPASAVTQALAVPDCMAAQGWIIVGMSAPPADMAAYESAMNKCGPLSGGGPPYRGEVAACLRNQGIDVPDVALGPSSVATTKQYPPTAAQAAWQACRDTYVRVSGMPPTAIPQALAVPDCMASQGWLIVVMAGPPTDMAAYNSAMQRCGSVTSGPPYRAEVIACLRAQGLDVLEPSVDAGSMVPSLRHPPEAAQAAWQACRDTYIRATGMPPSAVTQALLFPDCMAAQGWLIVVMSGPITDGSAYNTAMQKCRNP